MSTPDNVPVSGFSANSKSLKSFRLHQKMRGFMFAVVIGVPLLGGIIAYQLYLHVIVQPAEVAKAAQETIDADNAEQIATAAGAADPGAATANIPATTATPAPSSSAKSGSTKSTDGSSAATTPVGIPAGVTVALNSIEQNGIRNNQYVAADTSSVPEGTIVKTNRASWKSYSDSMGSVTGTIELQGQIHNGSITFELVSGTWRATGYSIDS